MSVLTLVTVTFMIQTDIFEDRRRLFTEAFNELSLLSVNTLMLYALLYDDTVGQRRAIGYAILTIVALLFCVNLAFLFVLFCE